MVWASAAGSIFWLYLSLYALVRFVMQKMCRCRAALKTENVGNGVGLLHLKRIRAQALCTLQKLPMESLVMQRLGSRVERPFCVSIEAAGLAAFAHRTRFRDPGSLVQT
jgi:hypothetical protein